MPRYATFIIDHNFKAIVSHARASSETHPTWGQMADPTLRKDGKKPDDIVFGVSEADVDLTKVPKALWLAKDHGIYLMSPGRAPLLQPGSDKDTMVSYAIQANPNQSANGSDWRDEQERIMGGDDSCHAIPLDVFEDAIASGSKRLRIAVSDRAFHFTELH